MNSLIKAKITARCGMLFSFNRLVQHSVNQNSNDGFGKHKMHLIFIRKINMSKLIVNT